MMDLHNVDYESIERLSVRALQRMEHAEIVIDPFIMSEVLQDLQDQYTSFRVQFAKERGSYAPVDLQTLREMSANDPENTALTHLLRTQKNHARLEQLAAILLLQEFSGLPRTLKLKYHIPERMPHFTGFSPIPLNEFSRGMRKTIVPPLGKRLFVAGYDLLDASVLGELSEDSLYLEAVRQGFHSFGEKYLPDIPVEKRYRYLRSLALEHMSLADGTLTQQLFNTISREENLPLFPPEKTREIYWAFTSQYLLATGYLEGLKFCETLISPTGRILRGEAVLRSVLTTAGDISRLGVSTVLFDERLAEWEFEPHLVNYSELVFSVNAETDAEDLKQYVLSDLNSVGIDGLISYCDEGDNWEHAGSIHVRRITSVQAG